MEVWNNQLLLAEGNWQDVKKAADSVRREVAKRLIEQRAVSCERGIEYWQTVPASGLSTVLFYTQNSPIWITTGLYHYYHQNGKSRQAKDMLISNLKSRWQMLSNLGATHAGIRPYIVGKYRAFRTLGSQWANRVSKQYIDDLEAEKSLTAERIGKLVCADIEKENFVHEVISVGLNNPELRAESPEQALLLLQNVLDNQLPPVNTHIPSFVVRWWPLAAAVLYGVWKLNGSWSSLVYWIQNSVFETMQAFYSNWIVDPLLKIYKTIRHDPTQKVALVAKESLVSDTLSLENMVVDFARDTDPSLTSTELETLRLKAANGDLTPVMAVYEKQLGSPMVNLVTGKLVRTLLIQVQKGKVDLEVALSGIDQLLQSQQLVFGLIAAIPAFGVLWWLTRLGLKQIYRQIYGSEAAKAESERKQVISALSNLDTVAQQAGQQLSDAEVGLVFVYVTMARQALKANTLGSQQLLKVLDRLVKHAISRKTSAVLGDLDRAYIRYQLR